MNAKNRGSRFSQNNEEQLIGQYFGTHVGTFLDIGANDGYTLSNSARLALYGWQGVCVEPSPVAFTRLREFHSARPGIECVAVAVGNECGTVDFHVSGEHLGTGDVSLVSTAGPIDERWKKAGIIYNTIAVPMVDVHTLLHMTKRAQFDFITIDIEGLDLQVFEQMDLTAMGTRMAIVEVNDSDETPFIAHAAKHGLRRWKRTPENLLFVQ